MVHLERLGPEERPAVEREAFDGLVAELFQSRRKAVGGLLGRRLGDRERALELLQGLGIPPEARPEALSVDQLVALATQS